VIAGSFPASNISIDTELTSRPQLAVEQQMINAQTGVARISISKVIPERVDLFVGMQNPYGVGPSLLDQSCKRFTHLDPKQGIVDPSFWFVYIRSVGMTL